MADRDYDPKVITPLEAAVIDAITESMDEPDAVSEARALLACLKLAGFVVIRDPNRPRTPYRSTPTDAQPEQSGDRRAEEPNGV